MAMLLMVWSFARKSDGDKIRTVEIALVLAFFSSRCNCQGIEEVEYYDEENYYDDGLNGPHHEHPIREWLKQQFKTLTDNRICFKVFSGVPRKSSLIALSWSTPTTLSPTMGVRDVVIAYTERLVTFANWELTFLLSLLPNRLAMACAQLIISQLKAESMQCLEFVVKTPASM